MTWATECDRTMLRMLFSRCNWPMRNLASNAQARLDLVSDEVLADIAIAPWRASKGTALPGKLRKSETNSPILPLW